MADTRHLNLPHHNNTDYPLAVKQQLASIKYDDETAKVLRYNQHLPKEFFTRSSNVRGILLAHAMGHGKTRIATAIGEDYRTYDPTRQIVILLPKSLEGNFRDSIVSYSKHDEDYVDANYKFVSLNSSRMFKQMEQVDMSNDEIAYEKRLGSFMDDVIKKNSLEGSMLIIDEAHNLFNAITNGAKNAMSLYDLIMKTHDIKLIFLTGTPIINDPFELVPCFNMCRGPIEMLDDDISRFERPEYTRRFGGVDDDDIVDDGDIADDTEIKHNTEVFDPTTVLAKKTILTPSKKYHKKHVESPKHAPKNNSNTKPQIKKRYTSLFSESRDEFDQYFIDRDNKTIKNKDKFANRIYGLTSYYGDIYFPPKSGRPGFPNELDTIIEKVPMSQSQFSMYITARDSELTETKKGYTATSARFSSSSGGSSTYRVKTRQISNYAIPEYALGPVRGMKSRKKFIERITIDDLQNTYEFSPKMEKILCNIKKKQDQPGMVYSQFVSGEGLGIFARVLEANGWINALESSTDNGYDIKEKTKVKFAVLSGKIAPNDRIKLIRKFNSPENRDGRLIRLLLLSGAVAEGIDLKRIRHVHVMEPFWNYARINQVKTRAIRFNSHIDLPINQQNVQVYIYLSTYPNDYPKSKIKELTTDVELYNKSMNNMQIINDFMLVIAETSIDCGAHYANLPKEVQARIKCKICSPNNTRLFHPLINKDMTLPNPCTPYKESKVNVKEMVVDETGEKFYYNNIDDNINIYMHNKKINGYMPMPRTHRFYGILMEKILLQTDD